MNTCFNKSQVCFQNQEVLMNASFNNIAIIILWKSLELVNAYVIHN